MTLFTLILLSENCSINRGDLSPKTQRKRKHITSIDKANWYLNRWIKRFNKQFGKKATESAFEKAPKPTQRNLLLARVSERGVDSGHHIRYQNNFYLPVEGQTPIFFIWKTKALVIEAFDGEIYLNNADKIFPTERLTWDTISWVWTGAWNKKRKTQVHSPTISPVETGIFQSIPS